MTPELFYVLMGICVLAGFGAGWSLGNSWGMKRMEALYEVFARKQG